MIWFSRADHMTPAKSRLPGGPWIGVIGAIHGRADLLKLDQIEADESNNLCTRSITVVLGDYLDREPASREVIDHF